MRAAILLAASALVLTACEPEKHVTALPIPPERMDCEAATGKRPKLGPEYQPNWQLALAQPTKEKAVEEAIRQHGLFVDVLRGREKAIATYILFVEGDLWQCANDDAWLREREAELAR